MKPSDTATVWHFLCAEPDQMRACNTCVRNPANQSEAVRNSKSQAWDMPTTASDGRCADWMARK